MPMMYLLQLLISLDNGCNLAIQILHFLCHYSPLSLQVDFLLVQFLIVYQIFFDEYATAVVEGRFALFEQVLVDLEIDQFLLEQLIFLEDFVNLVLNLDFRDKWPPLFQFGATEHCLFGREQVRALAFAFEVLDHQEQSLILIIQVLDLNFHLVDLGGFGISLEALNRLLLRLDDAVQLFYLFLEPQYESVIILLDVVLHEEFAHLLGLLRSIHGILLSKHTYTHFSQIKQGLPEG